MARRVNEAIRVGMALVLLLTWVPAAGAQTRPAPREARVIVTVLDPSGGVVPDATVTVVGLETATKATSVPGVKSNTQGVATVERLVPGRYSIQAEFPGFDFGMVNDIQLRAGDNRRVLVLPFRG